MASRKDRIQTVEWRSDDKEKDVQDAEFEREEDSLW